MFYKLSFDMDKLDEPVADGNRTIYAETTNMDDIEYENVKKGFFDNIILTPRTINNWPDVEFYYSSKVSNLEGDYLLNVKRWPIVHIRVMEEFIKKEIRGLQFYPIKLIDVVTHNINPELFTISLPICQKPYSYCVLMIFHFHLTGETIFIQKELLICYHYVGDQTIHKAKEKPYAQFKRNPAQMQ